MRAAPEPPHRFLDRGVVNTLPSYLGTLAEYNRVLKQKNRLLRDASEADLAVLERQLSTAEPFDPAERRHTVTVDTERDIRYAELAARLRRV